MPRMVDHEEEIKAALAGGRDAIEADAAGPQGIDQEDEPLWRADYLPTITPSSLRDWFAGQALVGMLAADPKEPHPQRPREETVRLVANAAYAFADAMLAERSK